MIVRHPEPKDYEGIKALIECFYKDSLNAYGMTFDSRSLMQYISNLQESSFVITDQEGQVHGCLGGQIIEQACTNEKTYQEIVWFVNPLNRSCGMKLLRHLEKWCARNRIQRIVMASMHNSMHERLDHFYQLMGYRPMETHYIKGIQHAANV